ncbi:MAG: redoxin domain-containing protein [Polyangiaceae bacterium]
MRFRSSAVLAALILAFAVASPIAHADDAPAWLGVAMEARSGVVIVTHVISGSPADKAGIKIGDKIERIDGTQVASPGEVQRLVSDHHSGETIDVKIGRASGETNIAVKAAQRPTMDEVLRMDHVGKIAPAWVGVQAATPGAPLSIGALKGKVAVVDFWAISCGPCRLTGPELAHIQAKYGAQGLTVVGITTDAKSDAAEFAERRSLGFSVLSDETGTTTQAYGISAIPTVYVVDKRGIVRDVMIGYDPDHGPRIEALAQKLLAEPSP